MKKKIGIITLPLNTNYGGLIQDVYKRQSYAILKMGAPAYAVFIVLVIINITVMIDAYFIVYSYVPHHGRHGSRSRHLGLLCHALAEVSG